MESKKKSPKSISSPSRRRRPPSLDPVGFVSFTHLLQPLKPPLSISLPSPSAASRHPHPISIVISQNQQPCTQTSLSSNRLLYPPSPRLRLTLTFPSPLSTDNSGASTTGHSNQSALPKVQQPPDPCHLPLSVLPSPAASSPRPKRGQSRSPSLSPLADRLSIVPDLFISINTEASPQQLRPPALLPQPPELQLEEEGKNNKNRTTDPRTDLHKRKIKINWLLGFCCLCRSPPARKKGGSRLDLPCWLNFYDDA